MLGAAALALLFLWLLHWKKNTTKRIGDERLVKLLTAGYSSKKFAFKFILFILAFAAGVLAVMHPRKPEKGSAGTRKGIDVAIALDVSKSMLAADLAPNRLERAKQFINKLMDEMPNDRIALVLFAGKAYLQMPLTTDHGAARMYVASAAPDAIPQQGTVVSEALNMSVNAFNTNDKKFKSVILITDGEDHDNNAIAAAKDLSDQGVMINAVGIGSPEGSTIPDVVPGESKRDNAGNIIISKLNEPMLEQIAAATNGTYVRLRSSDEAVKAIEKQLAQIDKKAFEDESQMSFRTFYLWPAALMLLLLVGEIFIAEKRRVAV